MAPPESVPRIQESDQLAAESRKWQATCRPILLQVGSEACVKCPAFTEAVQALGEEYEFGHYYCDAPEGGDIPETHGITKLPAVVIVRNGMSEIAEGIDAERLREMVRGLCARKKPADLNLFDADF